MINTLSTSGRSFGAKRISKPPYQYSLEEHIDSHSGEERLGIRERSKLDCFIDSPCRSRVFPVRSKANRCAFGTILK